MSVIHTHPARPAHQAYTHQADTPQAYILQALAHQVDTLPSPAHQVVTPQPDTLQAHQVHTHSVPAQAHL